MSDEIAQAPKVETSFSNAIVKDIPNTHLEPATSGTFNTYGTTYQSKQLAGLDTSLSVFYANLYNRPNIIYPNYSSGILIYRSVISCKYNHLPFEPIREYISRSYRELTVSRVEIGDTRPEWRTRTRANGTDTFIFISKVIGRYDINARSDCHKT